MALNFCKLNFLKRMMSTNINTKLVESLSNSPIANKLGDVTEILKAAPKLNNYPSELWQSTYQFLRKEGFSAHKFAYVISQNPKLLATPQSEIFASLNNWRGFQFGERDTIELLERYPELIHLPITRDLTIKLGIIKDYIGGGSNMIKLLMSSPQVLTQPIKAIQEKIDYLEKVMKIETSEVYKSEVFASDLMTIKTRHNFLKRLGLFIAKKKNDENEISKNPKLYQITDTSDKKFATKVCHVTLEEFETFQELYKRELEGRSENDEEEDNEEDYSDDEEVSTYRKGSKR